MKNIDQKVPADRRGMDGMEQIIVPEEGKVRKET